jgi:membrane protein
MLMRASGGLLRFGLAVMRRFFEDRSNQAAGHLTYITLLALVPLMTIALSVATAFPMFDSALNALQEFLLDNFLPDTGLDELGDQISELQAAAGRLTAIGVGVLTVTAVLLTLTIDDALNRIFRVERKRPLAARLALYWVVLTVMPVVVGGSISMTSVLVVESLGALDLNSLAETLLRLLPFVLTCGGLALLYILIPNRKVAVWHAIAGGLLAGVAFELAKRGFALYISHFPTSTVIYGTFATMFFFLIWVYLSWLLVLVGGTLTAMLPEYGHYRLAGRNRA